MLEPYRTAAREVEIERIEKRSKFIARVCPVTSAEEAEAFVARVRERHSSADHNVPTYIVGLHGEIQKCSDDGEPSGTAGSPILEVLKAHELVQTAVVVTRYFGGTLLGRGGLIRAYGRSAKEALETSRTALYTPCRQLTAAVDYSLAGRVEHFLLEQGIKPVDILYAADVRFVLQLSEQKAVLVQNAVQELTSAQAQWEWGEELYCREVVPLG